MRTVFIDPLRCVGCKDCELACTVAHSASRDAVLAMFEQPRPTPRIHVHPGPWLNTAFPNKCRHCDPGPCVQVCPTAAMHRDDRHGLVLVDVDRCIACAMCAMVCPFDVVTFHADAGAARATPVAIKCDGCIDRVAEDLEPACVEACKVAALVYGDLNDLVRMGRERRSLDVLQAANSQRIAPDVETDPLAAWQTWGRDAGRTAQEVDHVG